MLVDETQTSQVTTQTQAEEQKPSDSTVSEVSPKQEVKPEEPFKVFKTEEEFNKTFKSEVSKAKNEWLKEVGAASVDEFKASKSKYDEAAKNYDQVVKERNDLSDKLVVRELDVSDEFQNDLLTLAKAKVTPEKDLKTAAAEILQKNPGWKTNRAQQIKIGTEKSAPVETPTKDPLSSRYPWLG